MPYKYGALHVIVCVCLYAVVYVCVRTRALVHVCLCVFASLYVHPDPCMYVYVLLRFSHVQQFAYPS